ncbi:MAG: methyltransferase domain-containing protein [Acidobacteria bacterium]|nr:methyltransferase domain-containing protein [Acidobacteriota bacterium]
MSVDERVRDHFDLDATRFDAIYDDRKGRVARWVDDVWRGVVRRRFVLTLERIGPLAGRTVLDVGCGSGRYCLAYAERGAARVVGIDFAPAMIRLATDAARRAGVSDRCEFRVGRFPDAVPDGPFDIASAMGLFDYVAEPLPLLARMRELAQSTIVMSFPKAREWRVPFRRVRFWLSGCPLFFYTEAQVRDLLAAAGIRGYDWIPLDRDYLVIAHLDGDTARIS